MRRCHAPRCIDAFGKRNLRHLDRPAIHRHVDVNVRRAALIPAWVDRGERHIVLYPHADPVPHAATSRYTLLDLEMANRSAKRLYSIYIIELARTCVKEPCALAPVYVGQTAHTPEHRFAQHKAGGKLAAARACRFGTRLRYDLMKGIGPFSTRREAEAAEKAVAEALERRGHRVFWG